MQNVKIFGNEDQNSNLTLISKYDEKLNTKNLKYLGLKMSGKNDNKRKTQVMWIWIY